MVSVHLRGLRYAHTSATPVFDGVDLDLASLDGTARTWVGLVGPNGAGKTTLLRLVAGELTPAAGSVDVQASTPPRLVPQDVETLDDATGRFMSTWDGIAVRYRRRFGLGSEPTDWASLSPGQRRRWQLAAALADQPDLLLLDEPTNHLDATARATLLRELRVYRGLGLVVSHDRALLDALTVRTVRIHAGGLEVYSGGYGHASARWRAEEAAARTTHERAVRALRRERRVLAEVRRDRHSAEVAPRRERRLAGGQQPDAREKVRKFAQQTAERALAKRVGQMNSRVDRAEQAVEDAEVERELGGDLTLRAVTTGRRILVEVIGPVRHAGGGVWFEQVDLALRPSTRVHLVGDNGAGKTTLVRELLRRLADTGERVGVLEQELDDPAAEVARVRALAPEERGRVLGTVATLGVDPERVLVTDDPSPGEARKLALARFLAGDASVLVLDEPTNHLDLPSIERLQTALEGWPGALVLVTHDQQLADAVADVRWEVVDRKVIVDRPA